MFFSSVSKEEGEEVGGGQTNIVENKSEDNITLTATRVRESFQAIFSLRSSELRPLSHDSYFNQIYVFRLLETVSSTPFAD